ncbi:Peptidase [Hyphomicrobiales bacterium]|nr:Peptidase [Hyphomicrobiales bacterium]CAH1673612.1 Peptidase [Hyphomicrobiales bacterium]
MTARRLTILSMLAGTALIVAPAWCRPDIHFIWNASASVPIGLYRIVPADRIEVPDLAVVMPPDELAGFLDERGYLPRGVPLIKRVLALGGTIVCRSGSAIVAYGMTYGEARAEDTRGRPLPVWRGCRRLGDGEAFFMNWDSPDSFDSRYFGSLPLITVVGRAIPLWTDEDGAGRFAWRAGALISPQPEGD